MMGAAETITAEKLPAREANSGKSAHSISLALAQQSSTKLATKLRQQKEDKQQQLSDDTKTYVQNVVFRDLCHSFKQHRVK